MCPECVCIRGILFFRKENTYGETGRLAHVKNQVDHPRKCYLCVFTKYDVKTQTTFSTSDSGGSDQDKILDDYEEFVNKYIKLAQKAQNGDMSAITEYAKILEKAQSLGEKLEKVKSDLICKTS